MFVKRLRSDRPGCGKGRAFLLQQMPGSFNSDFLPWSRSQRSGGALFSTTSARTALRGPACARRPSAGRALAEATLTKVRAPALGWLLRRPRGRRSHRLTTRGTRRPTGWRWPPCPQSLSPGRVSQSLLSLRPLSSPAPTQTPPLLFALRGCGRLARCPLCPTWRQVRAVGGREANPEMSYPSPQS